MAIQTTTFKGARYLVKFHDPIEWSESESYEAIEAVQYGAYTYISKQPVPAGVQIDNTDFWLLWADPNAQMEQLRQLVEQYNDDVEQLNEELDNEIIARENTKGKKYSVLNYGAVGDGVTDDYQAIYNCIEAAAIDNGTVYFPIGYVFKINTSIIAADKVNIQMDSPILYTGSGTALTIGTVGNRYTVNRNHVIWVTSGKISGITLNSIGVHIIGQTDSVIYIKSATGFETNVLLEGTSNAPFGYNMVFLGELFYGKTQLHIKASGTTGWANENLFIGGRFASTINNEYYQQWSGIKIEGTNTTHKPNNNVFIKPSCEGALYAVNLITANANKFYSIRTEGCINALNSNDDCFYNYLECAYGASNEVTSYNASNFVKGEIEASYENYNDVIYDSGYLAGRAVSNDSNCTLGKDIFYVDSGTNLYTLPYRIVKHNNGIEIGNRHIAIEVDCSIQKKFMPVAKLLNNGTCGIFIILLDENGDILSDDNSVVGVGSAQFVKSTVTISGATVFSSVGTTRTTPWAFEVNNPNAKKAIIAFRAFSDYLERFTIKAPFIEQQSTIIGNRIKDGLTAIPTCEALAGDTCKDATGASNGWRYNGNSWVVA